MKTEQKKALFDEEKCFKMVSSGGLEAKKQSLTDCFLTRGEVMLMSKGSESNRNEFTKRVTAAS